MKKSIKLKLFRLLAALMILSQAVFLLGPINLVKAQNLTSVTLNSPSTATGNVTIVATTDDSTAEVIFEIGSEAEACWARISGTNNGAEYSLTWDSTGCPDGTYHVKAEAWLSSTLIVTSPPQLIIINNSTSSDSSGSGSGSSITTNLIMSIVSPTTSEISGSVLVSVQTNIAASAVNFNLSGFSRTDNWDISMLTVDESTNTYSFNLDTIGMGMENGGHTIWINAHADRGDGTLSYVQNSIDIIVNNGSSSSSGSSSGSGTDPTNTSDLTVTFISPTTAEISGTVTVSVQTDIVPNYINFNLTGFGHDDEYVGIDQGNNIYSFELDTTLLQDGGYFIWVNANANDEYGGTLYGSNSVEINVNNGTTYPDDTSSTATSTSYAGDNYLDFSLIENLDQPMQGNQKLTFSLDKEVDKLYVLIHGPRNERLYRYDSTPLYYYYIWPTTEFPNGSYEINVTAFKGSNTISKSYTAQINNSLDPIPEDQQPTVEEIINPPEEFSGDIDIKFVKPFDGFTAYGWVKLLVATFGPIQQVEFFSINDEALNSLGFGHLNSTGREWEFGLDTGTVPNGTYTLEARAKDIDGNTTTSNRISINVNNDENNTDYRTDNTEPSLYEPMPYVTTNENEFVDPYYGDKYPDGEYPKEIYNDPNFTEQSFIKHGDTLFMIPWECKEQGITNLEDCEQYFFKSHLPDECREVNAQTMEECDQIMKIAHMPRECIEKNIVNMEECERYLTALYMPPECSEAGAVTKEDCDKVTFKNFAPPICLEKGIEDEEECEKLLFNIDMPSDCKEAGIENDEACKKYMFEKYGGPENIPADKYPPECIKAGSQTIEECKNVMQKMYMPRECQEQGITDENKCEFYMNQKYMPRECQEAGATNREECDKIMFNKYSPIECQKSGITDEKDCKELMVNLYAPKVDCRGIDGDQCKKNISDRHIGNIVSTQAKFNEIKEKIGGNIGQSMTVSELKEKLDIAKEIIPLKRKDTNLKIVATQEELIIDESEKLIQTASIALMFDTDGDGLPDDIERRLGTNPNNADSDGDGYNDLEEIKNKYNPLGDGQFAELNLAPIEEAILENKILGQPKTEGEVTSELKIEKFSNTDEESGEGYNIAGLAEADSVVTLYIYSDLPIVVTAKADRYGNWQYDLQESLIDGEHEVYVAINDNTGKVISKSNPLNFFISEAKAMSVEDFIATATVAPETSQRSEGLIKYYIVIALLTVAVGILLFVIFIIQKRKKLSI